MEINKKIENFYNGSELKYDNKQEPYGLSFKTDCANHHVHRPCGSSTDLANICGKLPGYGRYADSERIWNENNFIGGAASGCGIFHI